MEYVNGDPRKLFLGGILNDATEEIVTDYFKQFGDVLGVDIPRHPFGGNCRGFCFVCFHDVESAQRALKHAEHIIHGKKVEVKQAIPKPSGCSANTSNKLSRLSKKIFVGGLPRDCTNEELREHFESFGAVADAYVVVNPNTSKKRGFGFITFESYAAAENALKSRSQILNNKLIEVKPAERKTTDSISSNLSIESYDNDNDSDSALRAFGLIQGNNVVHGQYNHNSYINIRQVNTGGYAYQHGAGYMMHMAYPSCYNYPIYYLPHSGQGYFV